MTSEPPHLVRRTLLYGAALGLLVGLGLVAISGTEGRAAIALWRNVILVGAAIGLVTGLVRRAWGEKEPPSPKDQSTP